MKRLKVLLVLIPGLIVMTSSINSLVSLDILEPQIQYLSKRLDSYHSKLSTGHQKAQLIRRMKENVLTIVDMFRTQKFDLNELEARLDEQLSIISKLGHENEKLITSIIQLKSTHSVDESSLKRLSNFIVSHLTLMDKLEKEISGSLLSATISMTESENNRALVIYPVANTGYTVKAKIDTLLDSTAFRATYPTIKRLTQLNSEKQGAIFPIDISGLAPGRHQIIIGIEYELYGKDTITITTHTFNIPE